MYCFASNHRFPLCSVSGCSYQFSLIPISSLRLSVYFVLCLALALCLSISPVITRFPVCFSYCIQKCELLLSCGFYHVSFSAKGFFTPTYDFENLSLIDYIMLYRYSIRKQ